MTSTSLLLALAGMACAFLLTRRKRPVRAAKGPDNAAPSLSRVMLHFELRINRAPIGDNQALSYDVPAG